MSKFIFKCKRLLSFAYLLKIILFYSCTFLRLYSIMLCASVCLRKRAIIMHQTPIVIRPHKQRSKTSYSISGESRTQSKKSILLTFWILLDHQPHITSKHLITPLKVWAKSGNHLITPFYKNIQYSLRITPFQIVNHISL